MTKDWWKLCRRSPSVGPNRNEKIRCERAPLFEIIFQLIHNVVHWQKQRISLKVVKSVTRKLLFDNNRWKPINTGKTVNAKLTSNCSIQFPMRRKSYIDRQIPIERKKNTRSTTICKFNSNGLLINYGIIDNLKNNGITNANVPVSGVLFGFACI